MNINRSKGKEKNFWKLILDNIGKQKKKEKKGENKKRIIYLTLLFFFLKQFSWNLVTLNQKVVRTFNFSRDGDFQKAQSQGYGVSIKSRG